MGGISAAWSPWDRHLVSHWIVLREREASWRGEGAYLSTPRVPGRSGVAPPGVSPRDDGEDGDDEGTATVEPLPGCRFGRVVRERRLRSRLVSSWRAPFFRSCGCDERLVSCCCDRGSSVAAGTVSHIGPWAMTARRKGAVRPGQAPPFGGGVF